MNYFSVISSAIISIFINVIFIPRIGIWGAVIATLASEILNTVIRIFELKTQTNFTFNWGLITKYSISSIIMYILVYKITLNLEPTIETTLLQLFLGLFIYLASTTVLRANVLFNLVKNKKL